MPIFGTAKPEVISDLAVLARAAYADVQSKLPAGWTLLTDLPVSAGSFDAQGYYVNGEAEGYVALGPDGAMAIVFRGSDSISDMVATKNDQESHYRALLPLIEAGDAYVDGHPDTVQQLYVAGHSLGGKMAEWFAASHTAADVGMPVTILNVGSGPIAADIDQSPYYVSDNLRADVIRFVQTDDPMPPSSVDTGSQVRIDIAWKADGEHDPRLYEESASKIAHSPLYGYTSVDTEVTILNPVARSSHVDAHAGPSLIIGGMGGDTVSGGDGRDLIDGCGGADSLSGNAGDDVLHGGAGNDIIDGGAGANTLFGGDGNDRILRAGPADAIDGGGGFDTLALAGAGSGLDFTALANDAIRGVERVDMTGGGQNSVKLNAADVLDLSDSTNTLRIDGDSGDSVQLSGDWQAGATQAVGGTNYAQFVAGSATVMVDTDVTAVVAAATA